MTDQKEPLQGRADTVDSGSDVIAYFDGLGARQRYMVHILDPSGESHYSKQRSDAKGKLEVRHGTPWIGLHVIEVHNDDRERERVAYAHATVNPPSDHPERSDAIKPQVHER